MLATVAPRLAPIETDPERAEGLEHQADLLARAVLRRGPRPRMWRASGFARQVDRVREQLRPIRSVESLADSYAREHFQAQQSATYGGVALLRRSATDVGYACRWLELTRDWTDAAWLRLLDESR